MPGIKELAYVVYEVSDLDAWERFGVDLIGMQIGQRTPNVLTLRNDEKAHRWVMTKGPADDLAVSGYEVESDAALDAIVARLRAAGVQVTEGSASLARERQVDRIVVTADPMGNRIELVTNFANAPTPFRSEVLVGKFLTGACGAGHQFILTGNVSQAEAMNFYHQLLGFRVSDRIVAEIAPGMMADAMFLHCNPRHHTIAFAAIPGFPKKTHHFMFQVAERQDVGYAWDRCLKAGQPLEMTLGSHPNDQMLSFYVKTPSGFALEYGWGGRTIDDESTWEVKTYDILDDWGHLNPARELDLLQQGLAKIH